MTLDANIHDWNVQHERAIRDVVGLSAVHYRLASHEDFPSHLIMAGNNWFYFAELRYFQNMKDKDLGNGVTLGLSQAFTIISKQALLSRYYIPLETIVDEFRPYLDQEFALFPVAEKRTAEVKALGEVKQQHDDWFDVYCADGRKITVFPIQPPERATYFGKTPQGDDIGIIPSG